METAMTEPTTMPAAFIGHGSPMNTLEHNRYTQARPGQHLMCPACRASADDTPR